MPRVLKAMVVICVVTAAGTDSVQAGHDVVLGDGGVPQGHVIDANGVPSLGAIVTMRRGRWSVTTTTNSESSFGVENVGGGVVEVGTPHGTHTVRAWSADAAPPAAENAAFLRDEHPGNFGGMGFANCMDHSDRDFSEHPLMTTPLDLISP